MKKINFIRLLVLMLVLMTGINSVWGYGYYYHYDGDYMSEVRFWFNDNGSKSTCNLKATDNTQDWSATPCDKLLLAGFTVWVWKNTGSGENITWSKMYYRFYPSSGTAPSYSTLDATGAHFEGNWDYNDHQTWYTDNTVDLLATAYKGGEYYFDYYFDTDGAGYLSNNSTQYRIKFTIKERVFATDYTADGTSEWSYDARAFTNGKYVIEDVSASTPFKFKVLFSETWTRAFEWTNVGSNTSLGNTTLSQDGSTSNIAFTTPAYTSDVVVTFTGSTVAVNCYQKYDVNVNAGSHGSVSPAVVEDVDGGGVPSDEITATADAGYYFSYWTLPDGVTAAEGYTYQSNPIKVYTSGPDKTITANFHSDDKIYFDNTYTQWDEVWVYFFNNDCWWNSGSLGVHPGANRVGYGQMTLVEGEENLYEYIYHSSSYYHQFDRVAFTCADKSGQDAFYETEAVYRGDWRSSMPIYVAPSNYTVVNSTNYHSDGYWMMKETVAGENVGYSLRGGGDELGVFTAVANGSHVSTCTYSAASTNDVYFFLNNIASQNYSTSDGVFTSTNNENRTIYHYDNFVAADHQMTLKPNVVGDYKFVLTQGLEKLTLTIEYPVQIGDHRLVYTFTKDAKTITRYSDIIGTGETSATSSMYIDKDATSASLKLQECTSIDGETKKPVWENVTGANGLISHFSTMGKGVYQFTVDITNKRLTDIEPYDGDYYIKTDCADGGWATYTNNKMEQNTINFSTSDASTYDYYFCKWISNTSTNVRCVVANAYNNAISDTLFGDATIGGVNKETLPASANVRFSYNSYTNEMNRSYISGSTNIRDRFLVLEGDDKMFNKDGNALTGDNRDHRVNEDETITRLD